MSEDEDLPRIHLEYNPQLYTLTMLDFFEFIPIFFGNKYTSDLYRPCGALKSSINASAWVADVTDTTNDGILEHDRFTNRHDVYNGICVSKN